MKSLQFTPKFILFLNKGQFPSPESSVGLEMAQRREFRGNKQGLGGFLVIFLPQG